MQDIGPATNARKVTVICSTEISNHSFEILIKNVVFLFTF